MNAVLVLLTICLAAAAANAQYEEITITAEKKIRHGMAPPVQPPAYYGNYGEPRASNLYMGVNPAAINPSYYPIVYGTNLTLFYLPETGQYYSGYPVQNAPQFYPGQQAYGNNVPTYGSGTYGAPGSYEGSGAPGTYGSSGAPGTYGGSGAPETYGVYGGPGGQQPVGFLSPAFIDSINQAQSTWTVSVF